MKRQDSVHIVVIPKLMTPIWMKQFYKAVDMVMKLPANNFFWSKAQFEPLLVGICSPYVRHFPWLVRNTAKAFQVARDVRRLLPHHELDAMNILRKFLVECRKLPSMPPDVVRRVLYFLPKPKVPNHEPSNKEIRRRSSKKRPIDKRMETSPPAKRRL